MKIYNGWIASENKIVNTKYISTANIISDAYYSGEEKSVYFETILSIHMNNKDTLLLLIRRTSHKSDLFFDKKLSDKQYLLETSAFRAHIKEANEIISRIYNP